MNLSAHQHREVANAMSGRIGILAGSPGTGKTHATAALVEALQYQRPGARIALAAPTGKAAVRLTEAFAERGLTNKATTIHRMLGVMSASGGWRFLHDQANPLPHDFIIVDEASMIDTPLANSLIQARAKGSHLLLVGDPHQLSPVGHGAPLRDLIAAGVPQGHLKEVRRNAGKIVHCCAAIRDHQQFISSKEIDTDEGENLFVANATDVEHQLRVIRDELEDAAMRGFDPVWDVQIICALNDKSGVSRKPLNKMLQGYLNPTGEQLEGQPFRVDDKVICTSNGRLPAADGCPRDEIDEEGKVYVANGEQAKVISVEARRFTVELSSPFRLVIVPRGKPAEGESGSGCSWELGYAISCHKSQGSQWPITIVVIDEAGGARRLCDRHWTMTAISRAQHLCVCVGRANTIQGFVKRSNLWKRRTFLTEKIRELETT